MRENAQAKGRRYLTEGRVIFTAVAPGHVRATVRGDGDVYVASFVAGAWSCTCPAKSDTCAHLVAIRLTTNPLENP